MTSRAQSYAPFGLVLSGGGARGLAHAGILRGLAHLGLRPTMIVGVSMGAVVGATYALNPFWYTAIKKMDVSRFPATPDFRKPGLGNRLKNLYAAQRVLSGMMFGWGIGEPAVAWGKAVLSELTRGQTLETAEPPVIVSATDIETGARVLIDTGPAVEALYASSALAGIVPPAERNGRWLVDGGYCDIAPVDALHSSGITRVIAVDASTSTYGPRPKSGVGAMMRALEICQNEHGRLRFDQADLVLRPNFDPPIEVLDFSNIRRCIAVGLVEVRRQRDQLAELLGYEQLDRFKAQQATATVARRPAPQSNQNHGLNTESSE